MSRKKKNKKEAVALKESTTSGEEETSKRDYTPLSLADLESFIVHESLSTGEFKEMAPQCRIHIHSKRKRLTDADGISAKAAIDGLVHGGLLQDDSPQFVQEVSYSQNKAKEEETIIEIWMDEE